MDSFLVSSNINQYSKIADNIKHRFDRSIPDIADQKSFETVSEKVNETIKS